MFNSTELFCVIDDFFLEFEATYWKFLKQSRHSIRIRPAQLSLSEINLIAIWYKCSHINNFKAFFSWLKQDKNHLFKNLPCYQRMIHLIYLWVDSTTLPVCKNQRIQRHKSLAKIASRG
jgi:hypothetical protein